LRATIPDRVAGTISQALRSTPLIRGSTSKF
jgi:hypothetical protein